MKNLKIGDLTLTCPIIQGGMGVGISMSGLASAVANEGGIGVIATAGVGIFEHDYHSNFLEANLRALKKEIQKARELTNGIIGVNIMVALTYYADIVKTAIDEKIDVIFSGAGLPLNLPQFLTKDSNTKLVPIVSSARAVSVICNKWKNTYDYLPDAIVVEGPKAGGHLGFKKDQINDKEFSLENLLVEVIEKVKYFRDKYKKDIPVIAGGGIYTGSDIKKIMALGADGVQMGTRFVTTDECDASLKFKQAYIDCNLEDIEIIDSPVGMPGRAIKSEFISKVNNGEKKPVKCPYKCLHTCQFETAPYCIANALANAMKGNFNSGFAFAGENAYKSSKIISVKETIEEINKEFDEAN